MLSCSSFSCIIRLYRSSSSHMAILISFPPPKACQERKYLFRILFPHAPHAVGHQHGNGHRAYAAGNRRNVRGLRRHAVEVHIPAELVVLVPVNSHVYDHSSVFHIAFIHHLRPAHGHHQDVRTLGDFPQILRPGMTHRHRAVLPQQQHGHGLAHDVAAAQHHALLPLDGDA